MNASATLAVLALLPASAPLAQVAGVAPDTLVMVASRDNYDLVYALAAGTFLLLLLVLILTLLGALREVHRGVWGMKRTLEEARDAVLKDEAVERLRETAGHIEAMAATLRSETDTAARSLRKVSDQVELAAHRMEERIEEFNALMAVVQDEAEEVFLDTAATARGVRSGIGELAGGSRQRSRPRSERAAGPPSAPAARAPEGRGSEPGPALGAPTPDPLPGGPASGPDRPPAPAPMTAASGRATDPTPSPPTPPPEEPRS